MTWTESHSETTGTLTCPFHRQGTEPGVVNGLEESTEGIKGLSTRNS